MRRWSGFRDTGVMNLLWSTHRTTAKPLDLSVLLGTSAWQRLPPAVRSRFAVGHPDSRYQGRMDLDRSRLGALLAWLAWPLRGPLVPYRATGVATSVSVREDAVGGGVTWTRTMGNRVVRSTKSAHPEGGVLERTVGGLAMALDVFEEAGVLVFQSRHYAWCWGPIYLRVPDVLSPGTCRVEHADLGDGRFRFTLTMAHPRWGITFQQTGVFLDPERKA